MGYSIGAYTFGENVKPKMDLDCPFTDCKYVGDEKFMDIVERYGSKVYLHDAWAPALYVRPEFFSYFFDLRKAVQEQIPENVEHFLGFLDWLREHPNHWLEGSH